VQVQLVSATDVWTYC